MSPSYQLDIPDRVVAQARAANQFPTQALEPRELSRPSELTLAGRVMMFERMILVELLLGWLFYRLAMRERLMRAGRS